MQELTGEKSNELMLVGVAASAGGLDALLRFFEHTPEDTGLAFAVLLRAAPEGAGPLAEVLRRKTQMLVTEATEEVVRVEANRVYCLRPDREVRVRRRAEQERSELLLRIVSTQEEERRRISRELHDQLGQSLTALRLKLEGLKGGAGGRSKLQGRITELIEIARRLDTDVDFLAWELRPTALDDLGLIVARSNYAREWSKHFGVAVNFHPAGLGDARLAPLVETSLYRIAQEALNNISPV